ncbi:MAG: hypothetical protein WDM70_00775 [Nitrosomonadales bacterium]
MRFNSSGHDAQGAAQELVADKVILAVGRVAIRRAWGRKGSG